jgi:NAD(P)-dependent dehydrogenase (short-subunit alcohol dehydrogenase family)
MSALPKTPSFRLDGRRALITGAGRGIGLACAVALAEAGAHVVCAARSENEIADLAETLRSQGFSAEALVMDVCDLETAQTLIAQHGPFDILVNNAGTNRPRPMLEIEAEDFDAVMELNVRAAYFVARNVARGMVAAGKKGSIITISSQMGHVGGPNRSIYCASKHAMEGMTKALAIELGPQGIRANTLCPTFILTELTKPYFENPDFKDWVLSKIKLGRIGTLEDLMGPVLFLASDASALVTGTALMVDGGWTAE